MIRLIGEMFSYEFIVRAFAVGALVSLCAALLGVSLVLKRYSMIGDGLSHVGFGALALAAVTNAAPMYVAVPVVIVSAILLLRISENSKIKGDAAIALISSGALAIGVMMVSVKKGVNIDLNNYMFGSILSVNTADAVLSAVLSAVVIILYMFFYNRIFAVTFDETFARATGTNAGIYNMLLAVLTAVTTVLGMRIMGTLLISSLIIFPSLTAMRVCRRFKTVVICAVAVSVICFFTGMIASYAFETPAGASVVVANIIMFALFCAVGAVTRRSA